MKRIFSSVLVSLALMLTGVTPVQADTLITIAGPSEQLADGRYLSNNLAISISPGGELANSLVNVARGTRTWVIDPAVLEEVADLVDGYVYLDPNGEEVAVEEFVVAQEWLELLKFLSRNDRVVALTYGGPSSAYLQRYAPGELSLYNQLSQSRLASLRVIEIRLLNLQIDYEYHLAITQLLHRATIFQSLLLMILINK